jgi:hypothetical protein
MKRLEQLNNVERAKIVFELFPAEISGFLEFMDAITDNLMRDPDQLKQQWENQFFQFGFWMELAADAQRRLKKYTHQLSQRSRLFADQLFDGYLGLYSAHCLHQYSMHGKPENPRFLHAIELFFK